ncbi:hypothetical protein MMC15_003236 [Xylographa vitiligo]|nr:hypothetical protein [Xylographa vitiligo]
MADHLEAGGFLHPTLPSPLALTITTPSATPSVLPSPRKHPLKPGSSKESNFIEYVNQKLLEISGRYERRFNIVSRQHAEHSNQTVASNGYENFGELAVDLENVIDIIWVSGTRMYPALVIVQRSQTPIASLQTPYLLNAALAVTTYLPSFTFSPRQTFQLLQKLDISFSSLLHGHNVETGEALPGFDGGRGKLTTTEKVRIRGLVERTRVAVVVAASKAGSADGESRVTETDAALTTDDDMMDGLEDNTNHGGWEMEVARVYERTLVDLGAALDSSHNNGYG